jgi:CheY-like chemotaxis protein
MRRFFIADDDEDDRDLFDLALRALSKDAVIVPTENGNDLLEHLSEQTPPFPDVIFLDINMPEKNGYDTLDEIRKDPLLKNVPVVILSTSTAEKDIDAMYEKGANYYISKPTSLDAFKKLLHPFVTNPLVFTQKRCRESFFLNNFIEQGS